MKQKSHDKIYTTRSAKDMMKLGADFAERLIGGEIIELVGELGAGKTTFVQGVGKALGVKVRVKSPSFTLVNIYPIEKGKIRQIIHADFFRCWSSKNCDEFGLVENQRPDSVIFIEWPKQKIIKKIRPTWTINFKHGQAADERFLILKRLERPLRPK